MWVTRKRAFDDEVAIKRHVMGIVFLFSKKVSMYANVKAEAHEVNQGGTHPIEPCDTVVFTVRVLLADVRIWNRSDLGDTYAEMDEV